MKKYTIFKNWHYAFFLFERLFGWYYDHKVFLITFKFSNECWWDTPRNLDDYDLNKLAGVMFGKTYRNSVRLAWRPNFDKPNAISLYGYVYDECRDERTFKHLCDVPTNQEYMCYLNLYDPEEYTFNLLGVGNFKMDNNTDDKKIQKKLYPYFGGNNTAPRKMSVWMSLKPA